MQLGSRRVAVGSGSSPREPRNDGANIAMDLHPVWEWFRWLHEATGIKLTIFYDAFDRGAVLRTAS